MSENAASAGKSSHRWWLIRRHLADRGSRSMLLLCALISVLVLAGVAVFTLTQGLPAFAHIGFIRFLTGTKWSPDNGEYGILPMIIGSVYVTALAAVLAIPLGIACAILLAEVAPGRVRGMLRPAIELLVGIPSVVYGLLGMVVIIPLVRHLGGTGYSVAAAAIVLALMVLPTIASISEDAIRAVPRSYRDGALALGATRWQMIWRVLLPAARSGIIASIMLAVGRAVGETMAMIMVIGNAVAIPSSPLGPARTLTGNIAVEIMYASGEHRAALFATGVVLFVLIVLINGTARLIVKRGG